MSRKAWTTKDILSANLNQSMIYMQNYKLNYKNCTSTPSDPHTRRGHYIKGTRLEFNQPARTELKIIQNDESMITLRIGKIPALRINYSPPWLRHYSGREGRGLFFTIARLDGNTDFGYIASARGGRFLTGTEPSTQFLFITRTASRAKGKPVSEDELKSMAKKIAASIKRYAEN